MMINQAQEIFKTTQEYVKKTPKEILEIADTIYFDYIENSDLFDDLEKILNPDVLELSSQDRKVPKYAPGFLDKPYLEGGMPVREKDRMVLEAILSGNYKYVEIEGGVRGGKDVISLFSWSKYLMTCKEKTHLAIGTSLEHVLRTVLHSSGFGLYYTIPHGIFIRESDSGGQRGVYKFVDNFGLEKEILFYGNAKENDHEKYQGFTLGSVYVNETLNQHIKGLNEATARIANSTQPLIIMTQNPEGAQHDYYVKFEKPKLASEEQIEMLLFIKENYKESFEIVEKRLKFGHEDPIIRDEDLLKKGIRWRELEKEQIIKMFLREKGKSSYKFLDTKDQIALNEQLLDVNYRYDKMIRNIPVQHFYPYIDKNHFLYGKSMKKVVNYDVGLDNVNGIKNNYDFFYMHYTVKDNMTMTEIQINDFLNSYGKGTAYYEQRGLGKRRSTEGAVYTSFDSDNILTGDVNEYDYTGKMRVITIDPGFNDPTGITEKAFDSLNGQIDYLRERLIDFNTEYIGRKSLEVIYEEMLKIVRMHPSRKVDAIIVDPSKPELISFLEAEGWPTYKADNSNWTPRRNEKETSEEITPREMRGIPLAQTAISKKKIRIHESCVNLITQVGSYTYDMIEDKNAHGDDLVVHLKYDVNTLNVTPMMWKDAEEIKNERGSTNEESGLSGNGNEKSSEWNMERKIAEAFSPFKEFEEDIVEEFWETDNDFFSNGGFFS